MKSLNERLMDALSPVLPTMPQVYTGNHDTYLAFNYDTVGADYGDNRPAMEKALIQVHLIAPIGVNTVRTRQTVKQALAAGGFGWPDMTDASDKSGQHYVFECEAVEEVNWDGNVHGRLQ